MPWIVDIRVWLDAKGRPKPGRKKDVARIGSMIESAAALEPGQIRETAVPCASPRSGGPCAHPLWARKNADDSIEIQCRTCRGDHIIIWGWQQTEFAEGSAEADGADVHWLH